MNTLKHIQEFLSALFSSLMSLIKILISSRPVSKLPSRKNDTCVILGNGPSLETSILEAGEILYQSDLICVNFFPLTHLFEQLKPRFFVACDSILWDKTFTSDLVVKSEKMFEQINSIVDWDFYLFMPRISKNKGDWHQRISTNKNIHVHYYNLTPVEGLKKINFYLYSFGLGMPRPHNVLIPSIVHAINLQYKRIFLLGVDHSWLSEIKTNDDNKVMVGQNHFYDDNTTKNQIRKSKTESMKLHEVLETFATVFRGYYELNDFSKTKNINIINSTPNSFIDAFNRQNL